MKRTVAVCLMAGVLLAMSTAAFASPVTVDLSSGTLVSDSIVSSGFNKSGKTITWFQPFSSSSAPAAPDATAAPYSLPAGGTYALETELTGGTLTIWANGVSPFGGYDSTGAPRPEIDTVWSGPSSSGPTWTAITPPAYLNAGNSQTGDSTTAFVVADGAILDALMGTDGSYIQVRLTDLGNWNDTVTKAELNVTGTYKWSYTYDVPDPPAPAPVVPAPGAILLASMGAGLVSWLRARKSL